MGTSAGDGAESDYATAVTSLRQAWARVLTTLRALDPQRHFDEATELGDLARQFESESVGERADAAARIKDAESLTLTVLGKRTRMTKQAAGRLIDRSRRRKEQ